MSTRKDRLLQVYEHLRTYYNIHSRTDLADALAIKRPGLYSAMNGNEAYLTGNLFKKICAAFQGVFNLDYLLTGEGSLLTQKEESRIEQKQASVQAPPPPPPSIDPSSMVNAIIAANAVAIEAKDQTIASLKREVDNRDDLIAALRNTIDSLSRNNAALDRHNADLHRRLQDLQFRLSSVSPSPTSVPSDLPSDLSRYPFPVGAADEKSAHLSPVSQQP